MSLQQHELGEATLNRALQALEIYGIDVDRDTIRPEHFSGLTYNDLLKAPDIGKVKAAKISSWLERYGVSLKKPLHPYVAPKVIWKCAADREAEIRELHLKWERDAIVYLESRGFVCNRGV